MQNHTAATETTANLLIGKRPKMVHAGYEVAGRWFPECGVRGGTAGMGVARKTARPVSCTKCLAKTEG